MAKSMYCPVCGESHPGVCPKAPASKAQTSIQDRVMPPAPKFLQYVADQEPWAQYTLENGAVVRVRIMVTKVEDLGVFLPDGQPSYKISMHQVLDVTWPEDIQRDIAKRQAGGHE